MECTKDGQLIEKLVSISFSNISGNKIQPPFESLPPELILNIFEYVPEAICELRLTSQALKCLADDFVHQRPTIPLVQKICFNDYFHRYDEVEQSLKENDPGTMRISLDVHVRLAPLFELRVKSCEFNRNDIMGRHENEDRGPLGYVNWYCFFNCAIPVANDANKSEWERLVECIGSTIGHVDVSIREKTELSQMCNLFEQFQIEKLEFDINQLSEIETKLLLKTVKNHKLEWLSLRMNTTTTPKLADFLLELSTHLRALELRGDFAVKTVEWVPQIIGMLSRKLNTLDINHWRGEILSREDADRLIVHLLFIGKKLWFKVGFALNTLGRSTKLNGHIIHETCPIPRPNKPRKDRALTIIHKSRLNTVRW